jgi:endonuclease/exonuclease/phosphatase family metal-dependent hydrolase
MKNVIGNSSKLIFIALFLLAQSVATADIEVMTQNQYLGSDLGPVITATTAVEFNVAVIDAMKQVAANTTEARIAAQAALIGERNPDVVSLQEVSAFGCLDPYATGACTDPAIAGAFGDHLALTLAALNGAYETAAMVVNFTAPAIPFDLYGLGVPAFLTVVDRDVVLRRADVVTSVVDYSGVCTKPILANGCNYFYGLGPVTTPYGDIFIERGYVGVDVTVGGKDYRVVNTHLEVKDPPVPPVIQAAQAQELIAALAATTPPDRSLVVLGDINSSPEDPPGAPYSQFVQSGYTDAWTLRPGKVPGLTCCQRGNLSNHTSILYERVDMIFTMESPAKVKHARVLGDVVATKTPPPGQGLWASDHGSVAAAIEFYQ